MNLDLIIDPNMNIPMVIASVDQLNVNTTLLLDLIDDHRTEILTQLNRYGAFLFRGFACQNADYFSNAIELCKLGNRCSTLDYDLPRTLLPHEIYTSSDLPAHVSLPLHHEKPRSKNPPKHIYFCCVTPAEQGGGTFFANAEAIWFDIPKTIQNKIIEHGVVYKQFFHGKSIKYSLLKKALGHKGIKSWSEYFGTTEKRQIEQKLMEIQVDWCWINKSNDLVLSNHLPGVLNHPITNQTLWFNSVAYLNYYSHFNSSELKKLCSYESIASRYLILKDRLPIVCHYGNGHAFSSDEITEINRVIQQHTRVFHWQQGDFMIVDNFTFMHGKQSHQGNRLLYSCMTSY